MQFKIQIGNICDVENLKMNHYVFSARRALEMCIQFRKNDKYLITLLTLQSIFLVKMEVGSSGEEIMREVPLSKVGATMEFDRLYLASNHTYLLGSILSQSLFFTSNII